jgi:hypothetical protein
VSSCLACVKEIPIYRARCACLLQSMPVFEMRSSSSAHRNLGRVGDPELLCS